MEIEQRHSSLLISYNNNAIINACDYMSYHSYAPVMKDTGIGRMSAVNLRKILTDLGFPTKPIVMTEVSCCNSSLMFPSLTKADRKQQILRGLAANLFAAPYVLHVNWYGIDENNLHWVADDAAVYNSFVTFMTSGAIQSVVLQADGGYRVTINGITKVF